MSARPIVNPHIVALESEPGPGPAYRRRRADIGPSLGTNMLAVTVYEIDRGHSLAPYRYELGNEQWLLVLEGRPTLSHEDGESGLERGDVVCCPEGPLGAHRLSNWRDEPVRVMLLSTAVEPSISVYPDDRKIEVRPPGTVFRIADAVPLVEDET